jgi:hypothetical protein
MNTSSWFCKINLFEGRSGENIIYRMYEIIQLNQPKADVTLVETLGETLVEKSLVESLGETLFLASLLRKCACKGCYVTILNFNYPFLVKAKTLTACCMVIKQRISSLIIQNR